MFIFKKKQQSQEEERIQFKLERIQNAKQDEKFRAPNPQGGILFPEENFIQYSVLQDGKQIKLQTYRYQPLPNVETKAIVFMFHGLCAHINHGAHIAKELAKVGCIVVGFDHRGFGKSEGTRGFLENLNIHLSDSENFVLYVLSHYQSKGIEKLPVFLMGLSMGGMTSFRLAIKNPTLIRGIVMFAPAIKPIQSKKLIKFAQTLGSLVPKLRLVKAKGGIVSKNPQITEELSKDPFTYTDEMLPGTAKTILTAMDEAQHMFNQLNTPWCLFQGGLDKLVDVCDLQINFNQPDISLYLEAESPAQDKTVYFLEDCWHDIWHEQEIIQAVPKLVQWVIQRI